MTATAPLTASATGGPARPGRRLGVFSQVHGRTGQDIREVYARLLDAIVAADELGVDTFWVGQHHVDPTSGRLPSPLPLLAAAAERTTRIRLGTAIVVLPLEDPLRLAEDAVVTDVLSGGRLELGVGAGGGSEPAYRAFGRGGTPDERRRAFDDHLTRLLDAVEGASLTGERTGPRLVPDAGDLRDRVWVAAGTVERAAAAGRRGVRLLTGTFSDTPAVQRAKIDAWAAAFDAEGHPEQRRRVSAGRFVYTGPSRAAIEEEVAAGLAAHQERIRAFAPELAALSTAQYLSRVTRYGTVDDVVAQLGADEGIADVATDFHAILSLYPAAGDVTPAADVEPRRIEELVTAIAPALGWRRG
ncbi:LLM class flavin-dependent oxidoreductase [Microbacterium sp.]|uniref:LLM class flavin-dependent oxidoreductase n=1 Tax=Microbacterium sp. TaxID=51671 RepID=UPI00289EA180|nr:LLM class flavin-dependent oxidoreductase [Microbacterium sp.]